MILDIIIEPNKILHTPAQPFADDEIISSDTQKLAMDMVQTMRAKNGVGLSGNQVGALKQICAIAKEFTPEKISDLVLLNPKVEKIGVGKIWDEEGCLSVPEIYGQVKRYKKIKVKAKNILGQNVEFIAEDFFARIIQHEIDHLNGILFIEKAKKLHKIEPTEKL